MSDTLPIGSIVVGKRHRRTFGNLESLAASIDELGVLHPPVVRPVGDKYELVAGERRLRAMRLLGWDEVPVTVVTLDDDEALIAEGAENFARDDMCPSDRVDYADALEPVERERARRRMVAGAPSEDFSEGGEARQRIAAAVGWSFPTLGKARDLVYAAREYPDDSEIAALVEKMDDTGNVSGLHKKLQDLLRQREAEEFQNVSVVDLSILKWMLAWGLIEFSRASNTKGQDYLEFFLDDLHSAEGRTGVMLR